MRLDITRHDARLLREALRLLRERKLRDIDVMGCDTDDQLALNRIDHIQAEVERATREAAREYAL